VYSCALTSPAGSGRRVRTVGSRRVSERRAHRIPADARRGVRRAAGRRGRRSARFNEARHAARGADSAPPDLRVSTGLGPAVISRWPARHAEPVYRICALKGWFVHQRQTTPRPPVRGQWATDLTHVYCGRDAWVPSRGGDAVALARRSPAPQPNTSVRFYREPAGGAGWLGVTGRSRCQTLAFAPVKRVVPGGTGGPRNRPDACRPQQRSR
jgi:hypothetical protein